MTVTRRRRAHTLALFAALSAGAAGCNLLIGLGGYDFGASSSGTSASGGAGGSSSSGGAAGSTGGSTGGTGGGWTDPPGAEWAVQMGGPDAPQNLAIRAVAVDSSNDVFVTGRWDDVSKESLGCKQSLEVGEMPYTGFAFELSAADGTCAWGMLLGGGAEGTAIAVDPADNLYVAGNFTGALPLVDPAFEGQSNGDAFVARIDAKSHMVTWAHQIGDGDWPSAAQTITSVASDGTKVTIAGTTVGSASVVDLSQGFADALCMTCQTGFVLRFDGASFDNPVPIGATDHATDQSVQDFRADKAGNFAVAGYTHGKLDLPPGVGQKPPGDGPGLFFGRWDSDETLAETIVVSLQADTVHGACAFDYPGNLLVAGEFNGTASVAGPALTNKGNADLFLVSYSADVPPYVQIGTNESGQGPSLGGLSVYPFAEAEKDSAPKVVLAGSFNGQLGFPGRSGPQIDTGDYMVTDGFVASLGADLSPRWLKPIGDNTAPATVDAVAIDHDGKTVIAGTFSGDVDLGDHHVDSMVTIL